MATFHPSRFSAGELYIEKEKHMTITIKEKEHWKERIEAKLKKAADGLLHKEAPGLIESVKKQAAEMAARELGGEPLVAELLCLREESLVIDRRLAEVAKALDAIAKDAGYVNPEPYRYRSELSTPGWDYAVEARQKLLESELLAKHPVGARVLRLRNEQESLLDTIWLSTSPTQIRELWKNVVALVNEELPTLQQQVLTTTPNPAEDA
jgi:hypothetical protein